MPLETEISLDEHGKITSDTLEIIVLGRDNDPSLNKKEECQSTYLNYHYNYQNTKQDYTFACSGTYSTGKNSMIYSG
jgi:hypothetical protein